MAAAAISAIGSALLPELPSLISLITGLVHQAAPAAEQKFGPSTGPVKFADVFTSVTTALQNAAVAGQIPKELPSDDIIKIIIQAVVSSMQLSGNLTGAPTTGTISTPATQSFSLRAGQSVTISVMQ